MLVEIVQVVFGDVVGDVDIVVDDFDLYIIFDVDVDGQVGCVCVLDSVVNCFLQNCFGVVGQDGVDNGQWVCVLDCGVQCGDCELVDDFVQLVVQICCLGGFGVQVEDCRLNFLNDFLEIVDVVVDGFLDGGDMCLWSGILQGEFDCEELLDDVVMQIMCDLVVIGQDFYFLYLLLCGCQLLGECSLVSEGGYYIELFVVEWLFIGIVKCDQYIGNGVGGMQWQYQGGFGFYWVVDCEVKLVELVGCMVVKDFFD